MAQDTLFSLQKDWADELEVSETEAGRLISRFNDLAGQWEKIQAMEGLSGNRTKAKLGKTRDALIDQQKFISKFASDTLFQVSQILLQRSAHDPEGYSDIYESLSESQDKTKKAIDYIEEKMFGVDLNPPKTAPGRLLRAVTKRLLPKRKEDVIVGSIDELKDLLENLSTSLKTVSEYGRHVPQDLRDDIMRRVGAIALSVQDWGSAPDQKGLAGRISATMTHLYETSEFLGKQKRKILATCTNKETAKDAELKDFVDELVKWRKNESVLSGNAKDIKRRFGVAEKRASNGKVRKFIKRALLFTGILGVVALAVNKIRNDRPDPLAKDIRHQNEAYLKDSTVLNNYNQWMAERFDSIKDKPLITQLEKIDSIIDTEIKTETDTSAVRPDTYWTLPPQVILSGHGDGREKAFLKEEACRYVGIKSENMFLSNGTSQEFNRMALVVTNPKHNKAFILDTKDAAGHVTTVAAKGLSKVDKPMIEKAIK